MRAFGLVLLLTILTLAFCYSSEVSLSSQQVHVVYEYLIFQKNCVSQYRDNTLPHIPVQCATVSQVLNMILIPLVLVLRVPQIILIFRNKSVHGLSYFGNNLQLVMTNLTLAYGLHRGFSAWIYGENAILSVQNFIILIGFFKFEKRNLSELVPSFIITLVVSAIFILQIVPGWCQQASIWFQLIVFLGARGSQIRKNYQFKTTKNLSTKTMAITLFANCARTFTILVEQPHSVGYLLNYLIPIFINGIICYQISYYSKEDEKQQSAQKSD